VENRSNQADIGYLFFNVFVFGVVFVPVVERKQT
jgi:hypothetical protein